MAAVEPVPIQCRLVDRVAVHLNQEPPAQLPQMCPLTDLAVLRQSSHRTRTNDLYEELSASELGIAAVDMAVLVLGAKYHRSPVAARARASRNWWDAVKGLHESLTRLESALRKAGILKDGEYLSDVREAIHATKVPESSTSQWIRDLEGQGVPSKVAEGWAKSFDAIVEKAKALFEPTSGY